MQNALDLVADSDRLMSMNDALFGTPGGNVQVIVFALGDATDGTGGADHMACDYAIGGALEVDASFGMSTRVSALFEAELSECSMQNNLCGVSTGEALSRWCAMQVSNNALSDFASGPTWAADGYPNFVDQVDPTDQNYDSIGCGMAFLSWLLSQGCTLGAIAQSMVANGDGATLADLYGALIGDAPSNAWSRFMSAVSNLPFGVTDDDPFAGISTPAPQPQPPPAPPPAPAPSPAPGVTLDQAIAWATQGLMQNWPSSTAGVATVQQGPNVLMTPVAPVGPPYPYKG